MASKLGVLILLCIYVHIQSAKILAIFHNPSRSHHILGSTLLEALALKGHDVTMISPYRFNTTLANYEDIELGGMLKYKEDGMVKRLMKQLSASIYRNFKIIEEHFGYVNEIFLNHPSVWNLLISDRQFDLIILNWAFNEAFLGIAHHFQASVVVFSSFGSSIVTNKITANPAPSSYVPNIIPPFPEEMSFFQRVINVVSKITYEAIDLRRLSAQERLLQRHFPNSPCLHDLVKNISLVLLNTHFSVESPRPYVPSMIPIGGFHIQEGNKLEGELKDLMDGASSGVVYFSLGANMESAYLDENKLKVVAETLSNLPLKVLWKFEGDDQPEVSSNVKIYKWFPQNDVLAHPNLKLFITQGGLLSMTEAMYHGVPMVGIPCFGDQENNVEHGVSNGYAIRVAYKDLTIETLTKAVNEVLNNFKYRENIKRHSLWIKDRPTKPLDTAVYWIEYVLRHNGAHHLKTSALKLYWFEYYLLDVIIFVLISFLILWSVIKACIKLLLQIIPRRPKIEPKKFL